MGSQTYHVGGIWVSLQFTDSKMKSYSNVRVPHPTRPTKLPRIFPIMCQACHCPRDLTCKILDLIKCPLICDTRTDQKLNYRCASKKFLDLTQA